MRAPTRCSGPASAPSDLAAIGITNQRETTVLWDRRTGEPVHHAIVWQDTRTDALVAELGGEGGQDRFRERTGLPLATYFSGPKIRWLLDADPALRARAEAGRDPLRHHGHLADLEPHRPPRHRRHQRQPHHADESVHSGLGRRAAARRSGCPRQMLPEIRRRPAVYGQAGGPLHGVPVAGALGDQQAALFGQACFDPGDAKCTYGTGAFLLLNTGTAPIPSQAGLITTVAYQLAGQPPVYALEGSIAVAGSLVQWLRDNLGLIGSASDMDDLARIGAGQRRCGDRAGLLRPVRAALARRRARRHRRPDRVRHQGPPRPGRARGDRLAGPRGGRRDGRRRRPRRWLSSKWTVA